MSENKPFKILTIDDEEAIRTSIKAFLEDCDYDVIEAENGLVGIDMFRSEHPDLILVDLRMPELDGLEVLSIIKSESPDTPVIVISGTGVISDVVEALHLGATDYMLKPIEDLSVLEYSIEKALERARLIKENHEYQKELEYLVQVRTMKLHESNKKLSDINSRLKTMVRSTQFLASHNNLIDFGRNLLNEFGTLMNSEGGSLYIFENNGLRLIHSLDPGHASSFIEIPVRKLSVFHKIVNLKNPIMIDDIRETHDVVTSGWQEYKNNSVIAFPLPNEDGEIIGILSLHSKIEPPYTDEDLEIGKILASYGAEAMRAVRAIEALQKNEKKYRNLIETTAEGYCLINRENLITDVNNAFCEILKFPKNELLNKTLFDFLDDENKEKLRKHINNHKDSFHRTYELVLKNKHGNEVFTLVNETLLFDDNKNSSGSFCMITDITANKLAEIEKEKLQSQLLQAQKMEAIGTLAGGIAHDFNNLLTVINGHADIMLLKMKEDDKLKQDLDEILKAGQKAHNLTKQLLAFSRKQIVKPTIFDINESISLMYKMSMRLIGEDISLVTEFNTDNLYIYADTGQFEQIILNLVINARDALHALKDKSAEKKIVIKTNKFHVNEEFAELNPAFSLDDYVVLTIVDTGTGMSDEVKSKIFDPFFTTKEVGKGTGLGLSTVYGIVKQNNGIINVSSTIGIGTRFDIYFPKVNKLKVSVEEDETDKDLLKGSENILFVEDDEQVRAFGKSVLKTMGYSVSCAINGRDALNLIENQNADFDMLVTDVIMPVMNGAELSEQVKLKYPDIKIIFTSGYPNEYIAKRGILNENVNFIQKPYSPVTILKKIRELFDE